MTITVSGTSTGKLNNLDVPGSTNGSILSTQSVSSSTWTKVTFNAEEIDTDGWFASSRYTPQQAGYYYVRAQAYFLGLQNQVAYIAVWRNGAEYARTSTESVKNSVTDLALSGNCLVHCNGSTDYFEIYVWQNGGTQNISNSGRAFTYIEIMLSRTD
jgi:hypothetical protein